MNTNRKVKLYVVYMEGANKLRTPVSVNFSEKIAHDERIFLATHFNRITFMVDVCFVTEPLKLMNEAIVNLKSLL